MDIARSARTYGVKRYFVVTPTRTLRLLAQKILDHWEHGYGSTYNETRKDALSLVALADDLDATVQLIREETGENACVSLTSARLGSRRYPLRRSKRARSPGVHRYWCLGQGGG